MQTFILWALPAGKADRLDEQPMTSFPLTAGQAEKVKAVAAKDGWHGFRLQVETNEAPNFAAALTTPQAKLDIASQDHRVTYREYVELSRRLSAVSPSTGKEG